jgi:hypothetical protein
MFFYKPKLFGTPKGGDKAYVLLRSALADSGR